MTTERRIREYLSDWRFWMGVAYFGLVATTVALFVLFNRTASEDAARAATAKSAASAQVSQCFTSVKTAPVIAGFIDAHEAIIDNGLLSNRAAIQASPANDPLLHVRMNAIVRLENAKQNVAALRTLIQKTTPTEQKCVLLGRRLHISIVPFTRGRRNP